MTTENTPNRISAIILTYNEEKIITATIKHLQRYRDEYGESLIGEVIVADTGSTDKTTEFAQQAGARVVSLNWHNHFAAARNKAMAMAYTEWVLFCDADESFSREFYKLLPEMTRLDQYDAFYIWRISIFDDEKVGEEYQPRLMRRQGAIWSGNLHEGITTTREASRVPKRFPMYHRHSMKRQFYNNLLYQNVRLGKERPPANRGAKEEDGKWREFENERSG